MSAAKSYYRGWFSASYVNQQEWYRNGERHGVHMYGRSGPAGDRRWRDAHVYEAQPWTVSVNAKSMDARDRGVDKVSSYRLPSRIKGVPIG